MAEVNVSFPVDVRPDALWVVLSDFAGFLNWAGEGEIRIEGHGVGMIRHLRLAIGELGERMIELDDENRTLGYALAYGEPFGMKEYQALVQVISSDPESGEIRWHGQFECLPGYDEQQVAEQLTAAFKGMTESLCTYVRGRI